MNTDNKYSLEGRNLDIQLTFQLAWGVGGLISLFEGQGLFLGYFFTKVVYSECTMIHSRVTSIFYIISPVQALFTVNSKVLVLILSG